MKRIIALLTILNELHNKRRVVSKRTSAADVAYDPFSAHAVVKAKIVVRKLKSYSHNRDDTVNIFVICILLITK